MLAECLESFLLMAMNAREKEIRVPFIPLERDLFTLTSPYFLSPLAEKTFKNVCKHQEFRYPALRSLGVYEVWEEMTFLKKPFVLCKSPCTIMFSYTGLIFVVVFQAVWCKDSVHFFVIKDFQLNCCTT